MQLEDLPPNWRPTTSAEEFFLYDEEPCELYEEQASVPDLTKAALVRNPDKSAYLLIKNDHALKISHPTFDNKLCEGWLVSDNYWLTLELKMNAGELLGDDDDGDNRKRPLRNNRKTALKQIRSSLLGLKHDYPDWYAELNNGKRRIIVFIGFSATFLNGIKPKHLSQDAQWVNEHKELCMSHGLPVATPEIGFGVELNPQLPTGRKVYKEMRDAIRLGLI